jgi:hypothetical protein
MAPAFRSALLPMLALMSCHVCCTKRKWCVPGAVATANYTKYSFGNISGLSFDPRSPGLIGDSKNVSAGAGRQNITVRKWLPTTHDGSDVGYSAASLAFSERDSIKLINLHNGAARLLAGGNHSGYRDGAGTLALFSSPLGISFSPDGEMIAVADFGNRRVRLVHSASGLVSTLNYDRMFDGPVDVAFIDGALVVADLHAIKVHARSCCWCLHSNDSVNHWHHILLTCSSPAAIENRMVGGHQYFGRQFSGWFRGRRGCSSILQPTTGYSLLCRLAHCRSRRYRQPSYSVSGHRHWVCTDSGRNRCTRVD